MSDRSARAFDPDTNPTPVNHLSTNGQWIFGSLYAALTLIGFSFGVWAGASKPKPVEVAEAKKKDGTDKPVDKAPATAIKPTAEPKTKEKEKEPEPAPKAKEPEPVTAEPKAKDPEPAPKTKEPEPKPKPKAKEPEPKKATTKAVAFKEVAPLFRQYCNNCHGAAGKPKAGVDLRTAVAILKGNENGALVKPGDPEQSPLYLSMKPPSGTMPPDGKPGPSEKELQLIHDWIASGAKPRRTVRRREGCERSGRPRLR